MNIPHLRYLAVVTATLGLTACVTVGPDYKPAATDLSAGWNRLDQAARPVATATETGDLSQWWQRLNDPLLTGLVEEAFQTSLDLRSAQARLREARARRSVATADRFPSVTASGSASRSRSSEDTGSGNTNNLFSVGFDASWELDLFGGIRRSVEAATADLESSAASLQETRVSLAAEVALNYVEVRSLQSRLGIARANLASQTETLQLTDWRAQAGLVNSQDVEQARSLREQTRAQVPSLETSLAEAEHRLDILLGKVPGTLHQRLAAAGSLPVVPDRVAVGIPADTLRQRPDVRAAEQTLAAETARVGVAEAARYPTFTLSGSIGLEALTVGALGNSGSAASSLFAGITAPVFNAGRLRNQVEIQDAVREQAQVAYEQTVLNALQDVENGLVALARTRERGEALASAAESARNASILARQRYGAGLIDFQSVLDTERSVLTIEDSLASTRADGVLALIRLYKALGGGWSPRAEAGKETP
ncbi:MAG: efflux transporter outer membrane subunit [Geobacter sp.]|nr:efflux transporter outer membrane subunit [Geobacter sp.]